MAVFPTSELNRTLRVVFFGTPEFAAVCLDSLVGSRHEVVGVVAARIAGPAADKRFSRRRSKPPRKHMASPCCSQPTSKTPNSMRHLPPGVQMYSSWLRFACCHEWCGMPLNLAPSTCTLLYCLSCLGAHPFNGQSFMAWLNPVFPPFSLQHAIDTGDVLLQERVAIDKADDAGALYGKLLNSGKALLVKTLNRLVAGELQPRPQALENPQLETPKLNRENTSIDWSESTDNVLNKIRGLPHFPKHGPHHLTEIPRC